MRKTTADKPQLLMKLYHYHTLPENVMAKYDATVH